MRTFVGLFCFAIGCLFLGLNSIILFRGAYRYGHDELDRLVFGIAAGAIPWVIAVLPLLITDTWRRSAFGIYRPSATTVAVAAVWVAFIGYNLTTGAGVIAGARLETVAERAKASEDVQIVREKRKRLQGQLEAIPGHRPTEAIDQELKALKTRKAFENSNGCASPETRDQRDNCTAIAKLEAERANAVYAGQVRAEIAEVEAKLARTGPVVSTADPQAEILRDMTGADEGKVRLWLSASTPIVLEIGAALMWHFGFSVWGISLAPRSHRERPQAAPSEPEPERNPAPLVTRERMTAGPVGVEAITAQRKLAEWFFSHCSRHAPSGSMPEGEWYEHYEALCRRSNDKPMPVEAFRRVASRHVPTMTMVEGEYVYIGVLPVVPQETA